MALGEGKEAIKAFIKSGPNLRELDLAVTDPKPNGITRITKFEFDKRTCKIIPVINAVLDGMTRIKEDPRNFMNNYLWKITGKTRISLCCLAWDDKEATFEITNYSPITRKGEICFTLVEK